MESFPVVWGLDIGHTSIKAVKMARSGDDVTVIGYAIEPIPRGDDVDRDTVVQEALAALSEREHINDAPVIVALSGRQIFSRTINVPVLNQNKIGRMVELEAKQQIPGDFNEVEWDYHLSPSVDGSSYDVALFAVRRELVENLVTLCDSAGIDLAGVSVTSLAVYNFVNYDQEFEPDESVVILDVGGENTDLVVYQGDHLWIRNLAFSGDDITKTFQKKFRVSFDEAEKLKMEVNESRQAERIMKVVEGSLGSLTADVQRSLGFYKSQNSEANFENIVVSGNTFRMEALSSYLANQLGYPIITLVELEAINVDPSLPHDQFLEDVQSLSTAIGLALQGVGVANASVNLLPSNIRIQGILRAKRWAAVVILVIIAISIGVSYMVKAQRADEHVVQQSLLETRSKELAAEEVPILTLVNEIVPKAQDMRAYRNFNLGKGQVQRVQASIITALQEVSEMSDLALHKSGIVPKDGDDPVRQPLYIDSITLPELKLTGDKPDNLFMPPTGRVVEIVIDIPRGVPLDEINKKIHAKLSSLTVGQTISQVRHVEKGVKLFSRVVSQGQQDKTKKYTFRWDTHMDEDGVRQPIIKTKSMRVISTVYRCTLGDYNGQD